MNGLIKKITPALCATVVSLTVMASDIPAQYPLFNVGRSAPNIMFTLDDSGSMTRDYMPESISGSGNSTSCISPNSLGVNVTKSLLSQYNAPPYNYGLTADVTVNLCIGSNYNHLYYNPSVTYTPRVNYLNQSLGNGTGTCVDPTFSTTNAVTHTVSTQTTKTYSNCAVTQIYKYTAATPQVGTCTKTTKPNTQLATDTKVPAVAGVAAVTHQVATTTWVDDKSTTTYTTVVDVPAVPAVAEYWAVPAGYQSSPYYASTTTKHASQSSYCQRWTDNVKYSVAGASCGSTTQNGADCATYVAATSASTQNGLAKCTLTTVTNTTTDGVTAYGTPSVASNQSLPNTKTDGTDGKCSLSTCASRFSTVGQAYSYTGTNPVITTTPPTQSTTGATTKTLNKSGACEYLKYAPSGAAVSDDTNIANYTHVMLNSTNNAYDSRQNGVSARTDCANNTACTYAEEKQNFLNWQTYYKTRLDVTKTMIGAAFANMDTRFRVGFAKINASPVIVTGVSEFTKANASSPRAVFFNNLYNTTVAASNPTPLRKAMDDVGQYFSTDTPWDGSSCRQTYNITMTDGNWTQERATVATGNVDNIQGPQITRPSQTNFF